MPARCNEETPPHYYLLLREEEGGSAVFGAACAHVQLRSQLQQQGHGCQELRRAAGLQDEAVGVHEQAGLRQHIGVKVFIRCVRDDAAGGLQA